jgi:ferric-dicitrate binding protein FerR (iron transport regulator)
MNDKFQSPSDFASDDSFRQWVLDPTPEREARWAAWLHAHPEQTENVKQAKTMVLALREAFSTFSRAEAEQELDRLQTRLDEKIPLDSTPRLIFQRKMVWMLAAAFACVLLAGYWWQSASEVSQPVGYRQMVSQAEQTMFEAKNTTARPLLVTLPDGSSVVLSTGAKVSFPNRFAAQRREVYLSGGAFFEVAKNAKQPFFVYANELIVKVLGTSFSINAVESSPKVEVLVKTGKVAIFSQKDSDKDRKMTSSDLSGVVLLPQQQATLDRRTNQFEFVTSAAPSSVALPIQSLEFSFRKAPVAEVFSSLESAYGLKFMFDRQTWEGCILTSELGDEPLAEKLKIICAALDAEYEVTDREVIIHGMGCR